VRHDPPATNAEGVKLAQALNQAIASLDSRMDPISQALAASRVAETLSKALAMVSGRRSRAVATAVTLPGMSMSKVADEFGISKSMVAKMAGPSEVRVQIAAKCGRVL